MNINNIELFVNPSHKNIIINQLTMDNYLVFNSRMQDFTNAFLNLFKAKHPEAYLTAFQIHGKGRHGKFHTAERLIRCNFYLNDNIADIDDDNNLILENVPCPLKNCKFCAHQNIICHPKVDMAISEREQEVAKLLASGYSALQISNMLYISIHTVTNHRKNIYKKLGVHDIGELTAHAYKTGWIK